jgi:hypothetical protein
MAIHRYRLLSVDQFSRASDLKPSHIRDVLRVFERKKLLGSIGNVGLRGGAKAPKLYYLTRSGYEAMIDAGGLSEDDVGSYVRAHTSTRWTPIMAHRMATIDLLLAAETGVRELDDYRLVQCFHEYRRVRRGRDQLQPETSDYVAKPFGSETRIVPDAAFILENIQTGNRGLFFVETDRGTERLTSGSDGSYSIVGKFKLYDQYLTGGRFADTYAEHGNFQFFTLLFVTTTEKRIANARSASMRLTEHLHPYFKLATFEDAQQRLLAPIWWSRDVRDPIRAGLIKNDVSDNGGTT